MSDSQYKDLYDSWRRKALKEGFTLNQFRSAINGIINADERCEITKAIGAKMAFRSLMEIRTVEIALIQKEMENIQWL